MPALTSLQNLPYASRWYVKVPEPPRQGSILSIGNRAGICMASFSLVMKSTFFAVAGSKKAAVPAYQAEGSRQAPSSHRWTSSHKIKDLLYVNAV